MSLAWSFPSPCYSRLCSHVAVALAWLLHQERFWQGQIPDRPTERLVAKFWKTGSVANANNSHKGRPCSMKTPNNIKSLWERLEESARISMHCPIQEVGISRLSLLRIPMKALSSFITISTSCKIKLMTIKQNDLRFLGILAKDWKQSWLVELYFLQWWELTATWVGISNPHDCWLVCLGVPQGKDL